jgi:hypothetical protein
MISRLAPVVLFLIAIGLFFAYTSPTYSENVQALRAEIRSYDAALRAAGEYKEKESRILAVRAGLSPDARERLEAFLPDGVDNVQLILDLDALADRSGVTLSNFDVTSPEASEDGDRLTLEGDSLVESLDIGVTAVGNYDAFKTFLAAAERSLRPLDLVELSIEDSDTGVYTYIMKFRIYWLR